ncbi:hypothetical protein GF352_00705 [archaeon]|nr:hypothetical protein [archaeon]
MQSLKDFKKDNEKNMLRLLLIKWLCDDNKWAANYMHVLSNLIGSDFTTKDLPFKSSRSYELAKEWTGKGLIRVIDYTSKARKYAFNTTLFAKSIENKEVSREVKDDLLNKLDELLLPD